MTKAELFLQLKKEGLTKEEALAMLNSDVDSSLVSVKETNEVASTSEDANIEPKVEVEDTPKESEVVPTSQNNFSIPDGYVLIRESDLTTIRQKGAIANTETRIEQPKSPDEILAKLIDGGN